MDKMQILVFLAGVAMATAGFKSNSYCCNPPDDFNGKLDRIVEYHDTNGDGVVTPQEIDRDIILYDLNGDCSISPYEWTSVWSCRYGDTPDKAFEIFQTVVPGQSAMSFEDFRPGAVNQTIAQFRALVTGFYPEVTGVVSG